MTGLFSKKKTLCSVCKKEVSHTHKPKNTWNVDGLLCGNCYVDLLEKNFEVDDGDRCTLCGATPGSFSLWKPKKEWELRGWLCKPCFDKKEKQDNDLKNFCCLCKAKIGLVSYSPKKEWDIKGYMCKSCWDAKTNNSSL